MTRLLLAPLLLAAAAYADADALRKGVVEIAKPGVPGPIELIGRKAFAVAVTRMGDGTNHPVVAGTHYGTGRVIAFGHGGYLHKSGWATGQTRRLVRNAVAWAGRGKKKVGIIGLTDLAALLEKNYDVRKIDMKRLPKQLRDIDVLCLDTPRLGGKENEKALAAFVRRGGGLVTAGLVWGWKQLNPGKTVARDYRPNAVLAPMGLVFADGYAGTILRVGDGLAGSHAGRALDELTRGGAQSTSVIMSAFRALPEGEREFRARVLELAAGKEAQRVPTRKQPILSTDGRVRLAMLVRHMEDGKLEARKVRAAPSAVDFPGAIPRGVPRVTREVSVDPSVPGWASTGLYAAPGEVIRFEFPEGAPATRFRARIGSHTDRLWDKKQWMRHPELSRSFALTRKAEIASPHGGLLYLEPPPRPSPPPFKVKISGAVEAPWFVLGTTDPNAWKNSIRHRRAPWAELGNSRIVFTVRSEDARKLEDPTALLEFWVGVLGLYAELGQRPLAPRPQRMVPDRQISAGWLHSGYPIMMQLQHSADVVDLELLRGSDKSKTPGWGFWHELGHNHQRGEWTFSGTTEVTCNLFSLYVGDRVRSIRPSANPWPMNARSKALLFLKGDRDFARWKKDPGIALWTYILIQEEFGWDAFQRVFREYAALPKSELPKSDDEKRDQWLVRLSRAAGRNLGPYFDAWGIPTSKEARESIAELEPWMPDFMENVSK